MDLVYIQESNKEEGMEQWFVEGQEASQKDVEEGKVPKVKV